MMFADDIVLCGNTREEVELKTEAWRRVSEERGLKINRKKTECLSFNEANKKTISMQGYEIKKVINFRYLGSTLSEAGESDLEVEKRIQVKLHRQTRS
jgi:hypothetical protein